MKVEPGKCLCGGPEKVITGKGEPYIERCPLYIHLRGRNPQTGEEMDEWRCAIAWLPILLVEVSQETRQGAAATESFRNLVLARAQQREIEYGQSEE